MTASENHPRSGPSAPQDSSDRKPSAIDLFSVFVYVLVTAALAGQVAFIAWVVNA